LPTFPKDQQVWTLGTIVRSPWPSVKRPGDPGQFPHRAIDSGRPKRGKIYPRDSWLGRVGVALLNAGFRPSRSSFRTYVHRTTDLDAILAAHGLVKGLRRTTLIWQLALYDRPVG
jgi:hypothetical protein